MNKLYNPKNIKPPIPTDVDEADSCMERFIRQKYQYRSLENGKPKPPSREDSSYSNPRAQSPVESRAPKDYDNSPEGSPPPLPPKSGKFFKFGLRSSSSTSNLRRFGSSKPKVTSPTSDKGDWSPPPLPSRKTTGLGAPVVDVTTASLESKMAALQEMGFTNDRRNEMVLRGLNEDLDRAVETLVRLGEGSNTVSRSRTPAGTSTAAPARAVTPKPETSSQPPKAFNNPYAGMPSNNPFDRAVSNPIPQQSQISAYNPFDRPNPAPASTQQLESSFQNLQVSNPLFPHSTGGYPNQASYMPQPAIQQPLTPTPQSSFFQSSYVASPGPMDGSYNPFDQPIQQQTQQQNGLAIQSSFNPNASQTNPFFNAMSHSQTMQAPAQQMTPSVPTLGNPNPPRHANTMPAMSSTSPFGATQTQGQQQQHVLNPSLGAYNPFQQGPAPVAQQSNGGFPGQFQANTQPQQPQGLQPQPTGQINKSSILSLYNMGATQPNTPPLPQQHQQYQQPQQLQQPQSQSQVTAGTNPFPQSNPYAPISQAQQGNIFQQPQSQQSFQPQQAQPAATTNNPFFGNSPTGAPTSAPTGAGSGLAAQAGIHHQQFPGLGNGTTNGQTGSATSPALGTTSSPFGPPTKSPFAGMAAPFTSTTMNSFAGPPATTSNFRGMHMSQPSVDVNGLQNGRHSPDAFASLSARHG